MSERFCVTPFRGTILFSRLDAYDRAKTWTDGSWVDNGWTVRPSSAYRYEPVLEWHISLQIYNRCRLHTNIDGARRNGRSSISHSDTGYRWRNLYNGHYKCSRKLGPRQAKATSYSSWQCSFFQNNVKLNKRPQHVSWALRKHITRTWFEFLFMSMLPCER